MSVNLFLQPLANATVQYEYKTDVLSTYNNLEDRIVQRNVPRIFFDYNYVINDYKQAIDLDTELQKNGNVGSVWLPDWLSGVKLTNITVGINTVTVDKYINVAKEQLVLLFNSDNSYEVTQIRELTINNNNAEIEFFSMNSYETAFIMPIFKCFVNNDGQQSRINTLNNTFTVQAVVKAPVFSPIRSHDVTLLGHDVLCDNFKLTDNEPAITTYQQTQENDYEIGLKDRFTFFNRMYDTFGIKLLVKQHELDYVRNFIKRRLGKMYSCFIPSGVADFVKSDNGQPIGNTLIVVNSDYDFSSRQFIAVYKDNNVWYAKITSANKGDTVTTLTLDSHITHVILNSDYSVKLSENVSIINAYPSEIDCIQSLFFARLNDDNVTFSIEGVSEDFENVYSIELSFMETEFYDSDNINYDTVDGIVFDKDVLFEVKCFSDTTVPNNDNNNTYMTLLRYDSFPTIAGKYEGTFAFNNISIVDREYLYDGETASKRKLITGEQDFVFQIECKFDTTKSAYPLIRSAGASACFEIRVKQGNDNQYYPFVIFNMTNESANFVYNNVIVLTKFDGTIDDWHEIALQRIDGVTYVYCDGYLNGSSLMFKGESLFAGSAINPYATNIRVSYVEFGDIYSLGQSCGWVQQVRLMVNKHLYTGSKMSTMNRVYYLFDYNLEQLEQMDNATIIKTDFIYDCIANNWRVTYPQDSHNGLTLTDNNYYGCDLCQHPMARYEQTVTGNANDPYKWMSLGSISNYNRGVTYIDLSTKAFHLSLSKYKLPYKWYKDLWFEFEISKSGEVANGQVLLYAENLMPTIYFSDNKWSVGAFGLNPNDNPSAQWVNTDSNINVVLSIDSQHNRVCVYINGTLSLTDTLVNVIKNNEHGCIGFYPLVSEKVNLHLHRFRIVDKCLTSEDTYNVNDLWKLGYTTTFFNFEFGKKQKDTYPVLRIVNIDTIYEYAPLYDVITNTNYKANYTYLWSDGSRKDKIVNPVGNTLYTVIVTDIKTGNVGYGWFFVHNGYTGEVCRSNMSCSISYDENGNEVKTDNFGIIRYDFNQQAYKKSHFWHTTGLEILQDEGGYRIHNTSSGSGWTFWDFFGEVGSGFVPPNTNYVWKAYHKFYINNYIKQFEFVQILSKDDVGSYYYTMNNITYYKMLQTPYNFYMTTRFLDNPLNPSDTNYHYGNYLMHLNSLGQDIPRGSYTYQYASYLYDDSWSIVYSPKFTLNYNQDKVYQSVTFSRSFEQGYYGSENNYYPNMDYIVSDKTGYEPIHFVIEPVLVLYFVPYSSWSYSGTSWLGIMIKNIWVNGVKHNVYDLIKNGTFPNMPFNYTGDYFTGISQNAQDFRMAELSSSDNGMGNSPIFFITAPKILRGDTSDYSYGVYQFLFKELGNLASEFCHSTNYKKSYSMSGFACYDYIKYTENFDASDKIRNYR